MKCWKVFLENDSMINLYSEDKNDIYNKYNDFFDFKIVKIEENTDLSYLEYIDKIKKCSIEKLISCDNYEIYKIPYNSSYILFKLYISQGNYINGCDYQRHDNKIFYEPIMWQLSTPKEFYNKFLKNNISSKLETISFKEIKKNKAKRISFKNYSVWIDKNGYFYVTNKDYLPTKKIREEFNIYKDNPECVYVEYSINDYNRKYKWFKNETEMMQFLKDYEKKNCYDDNGYKSMGDLRYKIVKKGYSKTNPDDKKNIWKLPYFNIDEQLKDSNNNVYVCAVIWSKITKTFSLNKLCIYDDDIEIYECVINSYLEWKKK